MKISEEPKVARARCHTNPNVSCSDCRLGALCLPIALSTEEVDQLDEIVKRGRPLQKGDHLFRESDEFHSVYAVRSGSFKAYSITDSGEVQVTGFYLPGEILGMDGISSRHHCASAVALEVSSVCEIPFERLEGLATKLPSLQHHFFRIMGKEIIKDQQMLTLLGCNSADERLSSLLLSISARNSSRHLSATKFRLAMTRSDIGNYLGITVETVSRSFGRLQKNNVLKVTNKEIEILDMDALKKAANVNQDK
ncbi:MAG: fumarate/nitrate reduction transcriptional regulator Fnr [Pseudomonadales bacterium]|nr:fumarate/nitrate reduction transcriptional regulator Fnr [Pseudomonadales bacterium]